MDVDQCVQSYNYVLIVIFLSLKGGLISRRYDETKHLIVTQNKS